MHPVEPSGRCRLPLKGQSCLSRGSAPLARVASTAGRDNIVPPMFSALNLWNDMIDVLCVLAAVLAQVLVPQEDRSPRQRHGAAIRNRHVAMEPYDRWDGERLKLGMPCTFRLCNHNGALPEQQHKSPSCRYDRQRLVRSVENQGSHRGEIVPPSA